MIDVAAAIAWGAAAVVAYVYAGYPAILWILAHIRNRKIRRGEINASVTLVISAFNEELTIAKKLENTLALDYPKEKIEVMVVSDASTDQTDPIVSGFSDRGINILRLPQRQGKTAGLNAALRAARGEIVVFSDANILYRRDAIGNLIRNFADAEVGCVTGDSRYEDAEPSEAHAQESAYWGYERFIRSMESRVGSTVGGDGAIFAIRRELYTPLPAEAINDLVTPLEIVARGYRAIFEPAAVGFESTAGNFRGEFRRKRRIVNRSWHGVMSVSEVLNPRRVGWFAWQVWSHKVLRWLVLPLILLAAGGCFIASPLGLHYRLGAWGFMASLALAGIGAFAPARWGRAATLPHAAWYFYLVNLAAVLGMAMALMGRVEMIWTPERRWDVNAR